MRVLLITSAVLQCSARQGFTREGIGPSMRVVIVLLFYFLVRAPTGARLTDLLGLSWGVLEPPKAEAAASELLALLDRSL